MFCKKCDVDLTKVAKSPKSPFREDTCANCVAVSLDEYNLLLEKIHLQQKLIERYELELQKSAV